jgi:glycosyltransferase involved in cell wall biosynthesis
VREQDRLIDLAPLAQQQVTPHTMTHQPPVLSLVIPCFNEERSIGYTIPRIVSAFRAAGHVVDVVAVDNGSSDGTASEIRGLAGEFPEVRLCTVPVNRGYGNGVLAGMAVATAPWVGTIPADGQVDAEDVVRLYEAADGADGLVLAKVRRRFRMDGLTRKVVSIGYNLFFRTLWPTLPSLDINGSPKMFPRSLLASLELESGGWLLDAEIVVKCHYLGVRVLELNVFARMRGSGLSHVRAGTVWEFLTKILAFRFGALSRWKRAHPTPVELRAG